MGITIKKNTPQQLSQQKNNKPDMSIHTKYKTKIHKPTEPGTQARDTRRTKKTK